MVGMNQSYNPFREDSTGLNSPNGVQPAWASAFPQVTGALLMPDWTLTIQSQDLNGNSRPDIEVSFEPLVTEVQEITAVAVTKASQWADMPADNAVEPGRFSALHWAALANKWANNPEDSAVEPGLFSAKHWSLKAQAVEDRIDLGALDYAVAATAADALATAADRIQTGLDKAGTAADLVQTGLDAAATAADRIQTALDAAATANHLIQTTEDAASTMADRYAIETKLLVYVTDDAETLTIAVSDTMVVAEGVSPYPTVTLEFATP